MKVIIYTTTTCTYCNLAKSLLNKNKINYKEINLEKNIKIFSQLKKKYNHHTVPLIIINKKFIGGYSELKSLINKNNL